MYISPTSKFLKSSLHLKSFSSLHYLLVRNLFVKHKMISSAMSHNYVNQFPNEILSLNNILLIVGLVEFLLLHLLTGTKRISNFCFLEFHSSIQSQLTSSDDSKDRAGRKERISELSTKQERRVDQSVSRGDVDIVFRSLGMFRNSDEAKIPASFDADDLFNLFEEENPSLDEVKEAFDVFDDNRDGFISAEELQKVLCALGLKEGSELENCTRMICVFDENGDGRMDFDEFVKFMENSLC